MLVNTVRHHEFGVLGPSVAALGEADFLLAERLAMGIAGIVFVRSAVANMAIDDNEGGHTIGAPENFDCLGQPLCIVSVANPLFIPAIGKKARRDIVAKS